MYPELHHFGREISLIKNSGVQFLDFGLKIDWSDKNWRAKRLGCFATTEGSGTLRRLLEHKDGNGFVDISDQNRIIKVDHEVSVEDSLKLFNRTWLPIPFLRTVPPNRYDHGPLNWARLYPVKLEQADEDGNTYRFIIAFDTKIFPNRSDVAYLAPTDEDVRSGVVYALAHGAEQSSWFLEHKWINDWILELFTELAPVEVRLKMYQDDIEQDVRSKVYQAHYLNILSLVAEEIEPPKIKIASHNREDIVQSIPVDMILDVGNSRTCGILIEDHAQDKDGLQKRYELELRDLSLPERVYNEPFESRIEFTQAFFGKDHFSVQSGRRDAFQWSTLARVGKEAGRLASRRDGSEGATGLSSPKRYLWDRSKYEQSWRFNSSYVQSDYQPYATSAPMSGLINEYGEALHTLRDEVDEEFERKMPVFQPKYSRSSLMTFMLSEVILQALTQINSPIQRAKLEHSRSPRYLRSIILTVPPAMPKPERDIFRQCVYQAIGLLWKALNWDLSDDDFDFSTVKSRENYWPHLPEVIIQWDEATCAQVVYFFNETQNNYGGRPEEFISTLRRPDNEKKDRITIGTIDIGGGTTDLVINDYFLDYGKNGGAGSNVYIVPEQRFRDGFKVAGDDILLDMIRDSVIPSIVTALKNLGLRDPDPILSELIGSQSLTVQDVLLRQQLTLQIFSPLALKILKAYEDFNLGNPDNNLSGRSFGDILSDLEQPTKDVLNYFNEPIKRATGNPDFSILEIPLTLDLGKVHNLFVQKDNHYDICKTFNALCEIINIYKCDVLLLTGRPSRLPGVQAYFRSRLPLPVGRILPLHHYRTGTWYPFHKQGKIDDPKTTAAVGAMLCFLSKSLRLSNFYFRSTAIKAYSTIKYVGLLDNNNVIADNNVYYSNIDLDNENYDFPEDAFEVRGNCRIGFRQLNVERWVASPLYILNVTSRDWASMISRDGVVLKVTLGIRNKNNRNDKEASEDFYIKSVEASNGRSCRRNEDIVLSLNTMTDVGLNETQYWLDSGCVKR